MNTLARFAWLFALAALSVSCATKAYTSSQTAEALEIARQARASLEETQERLRTTEARLAQMDQKATAAARFAQEAQAGADALRAEMAAQETQLARSANLAQGFLARADNAERSYRELTERLARLEQAGLGRPGPGPRPVAPPSTAPDTAARLELLTAVERYKQQFAQGMLKLVAPRTMTVDRAGEVTLAAGVPEAFARLEKLLNDERDSATQSVSKPTRLSHSMRAELTGDGFVINRIGSPDQTGVIADGATWQWKVVPKKPGQLTLTATLTAVIKDDDTDRTRDERVVSQDIVVEAVPQTVVETLKSWWAAYGPPAGYIYTTVITGAGTALIPYLVGWWRRRKKAHDESIYED